MMFLKINKKLKIKLISIFSIGLFLLVINLATELTSIFKIDSLLLLRSFLVISMLYIIRKNKINFGKKTKTLLIFWSILFLINIILNMVNVYEIDCHLSQKICEGTSFLFYKFKIFRFITLSSYFFMIPILFLIFLIFSSKLKFKKLNLLQTVFFMTLSVLIFSNLLKSFQIMYLSAIHSYQVMDENYYDRFTFKKGGVSYYGWIRVFSNFIISQTEEKSNFLLPPRSNAYKMEGNINYFRWFMYPRRLYHLEDIGDDKDIKINYVVLSAGECDNNLCVWPNYKIDKNEIEEIILINRETQKIEVINEVDYDPKLFYQKWGLIKLK